jgi:NAD(P)H dehydrogenase (quinone)
MKIGVSGASGHLGRAVVSELLQRPNGHEVVAITRTPETVSGLEERQVRRKARLKNR